MKEYPDVPPIEAAPAGLFDHGHLWIYEFVDGVQFRFELTEYGQLRIGDQQRSYDPDDVPLALRHATRQVSEQLDRDIVRRAVDDVAEITFFGRATVNTGIPYEWDRLPSFLGTDVWHGGRQQFLEPGSVENIYQRLGLHPINTVDREVNVRDFDPDSYSFPDSEWYDGPVAGLVIENKRGDRARRHNPAVERTTATNAAEQATSMALAEELATDERFDRVLGDLGTSDDPVTFDAVHERLFETIVREEYHRFEGSHAIEPAQLRSSLADVVGEFLSET